MPVRHHVSPDERAGPALILLTAVMVERTEARTQRLGSTGRRVDASWTAFGASLLPSSQTGSETQSRLSETLMSSWHVDLDRLDTAASLPTP